MTNKTRKKMHLWLHFSVLKKGIMLLALFLLPISVLGQDINISGVVSDENNEPVIGVSVVVKGRATVGTVTDLDGNYKLTTKTDDVLVFSYLGMTTQEIPVNGRTEINVQLLTNASELDEVVVIAYGQQKKLTITGAVSNVGSKELLKSPAASLSNSLAGRLPGVQSVQYSGRPGGDDAMLRVRGVGSFNSAEPLVLVDGVERSFSQIDPNEVADITILKDASATAVFGVRGANGVILVTTKRGEVGKPSVTFTAQGGIQQITQFLKPANSFEYATAYNKAQQYDGTPENEWKYKPDMLQHFKDMDMPTAYPSTDWFKYLMNNEAWQSQYNLNVSGGSEKAKYFVSAGMLDQDGLFKTFNADPEANFKYRRYNYRANIDLDLNKYNQLQVNIGGRVENRNSIAGGDYGVEGMFGNEGLFNRGMPMSGYGLDDQGRRIVSDQALVGTHGGDALGRFYELGYEQQSTNVLNLDLQYRLKLDFITKGLEFKIKGSYNSAYTAQKDRRTGGGLAYRATIAEGETDANGLPKVVFVRSGANYPLGYKEARWGDRNWYTEASFNYTRKFGDHNVGTLLLYNQSKRYYPWDSQGEIYKSIPTGYVGTVGRVTYDYDSRYLLDLNMGYNGSENFAKGRRYGFFPSASVGWIASSEKFWEPISEIVPYLKLRASLGKVGNDNTNNLRFLYLPGSYAFIGVPGEWDQSVGNGTAHFGDNGAYLPGVREASNGNPFVTWETAMKQNYGVDLKLLNSKLSISADFFFEDRKNILEPNDATLPGVLAQKPISVNYGRVKNHGYELTIRWEDKVGDLYYSIAPALSFARNETVRYMTVKQDYDYQYRYGLPVGQPFGHEFFEFYEPGETEKRYKTKYGKDMPTQIETPKAGDCVYVDWNNDGKIDQYDRHAIGFTDVPEYTGSVNFNLNYKGFDFSMLWIGAANVNRSLGMFYRPPFGTQNMSMLNKWIYENSWTEETASTAILPRFTLSTAHSNYEDSKIWLVDASYIRLKNVEIGYTFKIPGVSQINNIRVYASGYNLLTFSDFKANDPESNGGSWNTMRYPMTRVYNFGININF